MPEISSVAVLGGTGHQGRGLSQRFARAGVAVIVGSRDPRLAREAVSAWGGPEIEVLDNARAAAAADVVVLAVPFDGLAPMLDAVASQLRAGALVIDVAVPLAFAGRTVSMLEVAEGSASEHVRARVPPHVAVAGTFKTLPAQLLARTSEPLDCDEFICGDSEEARQRAAGLVALLPALRGIDVGPLSRARSIEHLTALAVAINRRHKIHDARFRVVGVS